MKLIKIILTFLCFMENLVHLKCQNEESEPPKFLEFPFKRNLTRNDKLTPEEFFKTYFYNQLYINLKVGSNKLEIPFYFYLHQYPVVLQPKNVKENEVKGKYDETESKSYKPLNEEETFNYGDLYKGILSRDIFYFNDNNGVPTEFYLSKENLQNAHITEGGKIGFRMKPKYGESEGTSFIKSLKEKFIISSPVLTLEYNSKKEEEDSGKIYIGAYPHLFDSSRFKEEYFESSLAQADDGELNWILFFEEFQINSQTYEKSKNAFLYSELGFIIGNNNFFDYLNKTEAWEEYFYTKKKCHMLNFRINDFEGNDYFVRFLFEYTGYYCDKDVDVEKLNIHNITFVSKTDKYSLNLTYKDIWMEKNGYKYLMIIKSGDILDNVWFLGKPFFKKYQMVFDFDSKIIGFYSKVFNEENPSDDESSGNSIVKYVLIIVALSLIIIGLIVFLIKCYFDLPRRKRANELLDDNYNYDENGIKEEKGINE